MSFDKRSLSFFKPEDFMTKTAVDDADSYQQTLANKCNRLLQERGVRVYGRLKDGTINPPSLSSYITPDAETHQALLVAIEELPKKECKHEPSHYLGPIECKHCGVALKARWEAAE